MSYYCKRSSLYGSLSPRALRKAQSQPLQITGRRYRSWDTILPQLTEAQHAALTSFEAYLVQFSVVGQARGFPLLEAVPPADHPYPTFEPRLPVAFMNCAITLDQAHLSPDVTLVSIDIHPLFYCSYCRIVKTFKSLPGYWAHIRDGHALVPEQTRMDDMIRAGNVWQAHREIAARQGAHINHEDVTWKQVQQTKEDGFSWAVVLSWKLAYARKRKYGKTVTKEDESSEMST